MGIISICVVFREKSVTNLHCQLGRQFASLPSPLTTSDLFLETWDVPNLGTNQEKIQNEVD